MVYPKHIGHAKAAEARPNPPASSSPPLLSSNDDLDNAQPSNHASVSLMSIVAGASAPQVIPSTPTPTPAPPRTSPPTASLLPPTSPPQTLSPSLPQKSELSPFNDWPSPAPTTTSPAKLQKTPSKRNPTHILNSNPAGSDSDDEHSLLTRTPSTNGRISTPNSNSKAFHRRSSMVDFPSSAALSHIPPSHLSTRNVTASQPYPEPSIPPQPPNLTIVGRAINNPDLPGSTHSLLPTTQPDHSNENSSFSQNETTHVAKNVKIQPLAEKHSPPNPFLDAISPFGNPDLPPPRTFPTPLPSTSSQPPTPTQNPGQPIFPTPTQTPHILPTHSGLPASIPHSHPLPPPPPTPNHQLLDNKPKVPNPFLNNDAIPVFPGSSSAELPRHIFGAHFDFTVPTRKSASQLLFELPLDIWSQICTHLNLAEVAALTRVCPSLHRTMAHNTVWCAIATARWPEAQSNATAGINWKQLCLLYQSKTFPHLVLRDYAGTSRGRYHLISCMFIGDDSEMGGAESVFFLNKISKSSAVSRASMKANVMTLEYAPYYFLTVSLSQLNKIAMPFERSSAIVIPILTRSSQNTNVETVLPKRYISELNIVLQEAGPTSPLIVFFHFNPVQNAPPTGDATFVQKLVGVFHDIEVASSLQEIACAALQLQIRKWILGWSVVDGLQYSATPLAVTRGSAPLRISRVE